MSFVSIAFFLFLPVVFALHYAVQNRRWQNCVLLGASYFFYGWWDYRFCGLLLFGSLLDYWSGLRISRSTDVRVRKFYLFVSIAGNLGLLGFFKYFNFFADSMVTFLAVIGLDVNTSTLKIILPVGISFYTFQTLSYTIDIYRGQFQPRRDLIEYLAFVSFFPQLVAGPIERARDLLPQFCQTRSFSHDNAIAGCRLILWGFLKKMVLADSLGIVADRAFGNSQTASPEELAVGTIFFAFQIYGDFSGYSDMAAGVASLFGIRLRRNFDYPYFSQSLTEFWRRWHISLSTWFRDYVFIPLGGSRGSGRQTAVNILVTMAISGLWHGAAWHFVAWGVFHGVLLSVDRYAGRARKTIPELPGGSALLPDAVTLIRIIGTFSLVCVGWILFRAASLDHAFSILARIVSAMVHPSFYSGLITSIQTESVRWLMLAGFVSVEWFGRRRWNPLPFPQLSQVVRWTVYTAAAWALLLFGTQHPAEFIYFQF